MAKRTYTIFSKILDILAHVNGIGRGTLPTGTSSAKIDLNNYIKTGVYWVNNLDYKTNLPPEAGAGWLKVIRPHPTISSSSGSFTCLQIYISYNTSYPIWYRNLVRGINSNNWSSWSSYETLDDTQYDELWGLNHITNWSA